MKFENTDIFNFEGAIRGMRNPMESWEKSDSKFLGGRTTIYPEDVTSEDMELGKNDLSLMQKLIKAGKDHRKFMRQIFVCVDITAPLYWWKEFDTYKIGTVANSTSTMHKISSKEINEQNFEIDLDTFDRDLKINTETASELWGNTITTIESIRKLYIETKDKRYWKLLIQQLPESWLQKRTVTMSYENLVSIAHSDRKNHKLDEWKIEFFNWMHSLPYSNELIFIDLTPMYIKKAIEQLEDIADLLSKGLADNIHTSELLLKIAKELGGN